MATESEAAADDAPGRLRDRLRSFAVNRTNHAIFGVLLLKVASAAVSFLLFSFAARSMGADEFGRFAIWFSVISVLSVVAVFGQELMIVRAWNEHHRDHPGLAKGALIFGFAVTIGLATPVSLAAAGYEIATDGDAALAVGVGMFLLLHTILLFTTHASRAIVGIFNGDTHREITWRVIVIAVLGFALATGALVTTAEFFRLAAAGIACSITIQLLAIHKRLPKAVQDARAQYDAATWLPRSWKMWLSAIMESINQYAEVIVVGWLIHPAAAGAYFVAARLANSFQIAASGINTFGTRHVPRLYYAGETEELARVMRMMAIFTAIIVVGGLVCVLVGGKLMLWIFGAQYMDQYPVLLTLSVGTAAVAAAGPAPSILLLTGHEGRYLAVIAAGVALRLCGLFLLIPLAGVMGAALATAISFLVITIVLNTECRRLTGLDPSIGRLLRGHASDPDPIPTSDFSPSTKGST